MKIDVGYTHSTQSSADIEIDDKHYLEWCKERGFPGDENLLQDENVILMYLNYDPQFLNELIGCGETDVQAFDIDLT